LFLQAPNEPAATTHSAKDSPSSSAETAVNQVKTSHEKDSSSQRNNAGSFVPVLGDYPDSDGGVELPKHMDTTNSHGIVFGGQIDSQSGDGHSDSPGSGPETPDGTGEGVEMVASILECCGQN
jgi:hypothetical protein